tara:strand:+ start:1713 stop:2105 length:393 start_codon:yes stop_codon:yes gene_type:complete
MPALNHAAALEKAAQLLAQWRGKDYSDERMLDHYLERVEKPRKAIAAVVAVADEITRPLLDTIADLEAEEALLQGRVRELRADLRNLVEYFTAMPDRLPEHFEETFTGTELKAWLVREISAAPTVRGFHE